MFSFILLGSPLALLLGFFSTAFIRTKYFSFWKKKSNRKRERLLLLFSSYLVWLLFILLISNNALQGLGVELGVDTQAKAEKLWGLNLVPFRTILTYHKHVTGFNYFSNIWGNVILVIPLGLLPPLLWKKYNRYLLLLAHTFLFLLLVETTQFLTGRSGDIDDVILNLVGMSLGYFLSGLLKEAFPRKMYQR